LESRQGMVVRLGYVKSPQSTWMLLFIHVSQRSLVPRVCQPTRRKKKNAPSATTSIM